MSPTEQEQTQLLREESVAKQDEKPTCGQKFSKGLQDFKTFLYNPEAGTVMGRTGKSWAKIGFFYLIFYGFLAAFFSAMLAVFMTTVKQPGGGNGPKLTQFIENKPGLTRLDRSYKLESYKISDSKFIEDYANTTTKMLMAYNTSHHSGKKCGTEAAKESEKPCVFDLTLLGECNPKKNPKLGLDKGKPCIFIRVNKVFGWVPEGDEYLKLTCNDGTQAPDGFLIAAFPFKGQKGYVAPVVSVKVDASNGNSGEIDCELSGKNIKVSDSFNPSRVFGKIRIDGITASN